MSRDLRPSRYHAFGEELQGCTKCPLARVPINRPFGAKLPGYGDVHSPILFVAQNPSFRRIGKYADRVFASGSTHDNFFCDALKSVGVRREQVFVTNYIKCSTLNNDEPSDRLHGDPCCETWLYPEIHLLNPKVIIAVGRHAARVFEARKDHVVLWQQRRVFLLTHPGFYFRAKLPLSIYEEEFQRLDDLGAFSDLR